MDRKQHLYVSIWKKHLADIIDLAAYRPESLLQLSAEDFIAASKRDKSGYTFNLTIENGKITAISNSAVARDFADVLMEDSSAVEFLQGKKVHFSLQSNFTIVTNVNP